MFFYRDTQPAEAFAVENCELLVRVTDVHDVTGGREDRAELFDHGCDEHVLAPGRERDLDSVREGHWDSVADAFHPPGFAEISDSKPIAMQLERPVRSSVRAEHRKRNLANLVGVLRAVDRPMWVVGVSHDETRRLELVDGLASNSLARVWCVPLAIVRRHMVHEWRDTTEGRTRVGPTRSWAEVEQRKKGQT